MNKLQKCPINCIFLQCKGIYGLWLSWLYNFVQDVLQKIGLDPNLLQEKLQVSWANSDLRKRLRKIEGEQGRMDEERKWLGRWRTWLKDKNTEDDVKFRGKWCNVLLYTPKQFVILNIIVLGFLLVRSSKPRPHQNKLWKSGD